MNSSFPQRPLISKSNFIAIKIKGTCIQRSPQHFEYCKTATTKVEPQISKADTCDF